MLQLNFPAPVGMTGTSILCFAGASPTFCNVLLVPNASSAIIFGQVEQHGCIFGQEGTVEVPCTLQKWGVQAAVFLFRSYSPGAASQALAPGLFVIYPQTCLMSALQNIALLQQVLCQYIEGTSQCHDAAGLAGSTSRTRGNKGPGVQAAQ